jgi:hypothetical protein
MRHGGRGFGHPRLDGGDPRLDQTGDVVEIQPKRMTKRSAFRGSVAAWLTISATLAPVANRLLEGMTIRAMIDERRK